LRGDDRTAAIGGGIDLVHGRRAANRPCHDHERRPAGAHRPAIRIVASRDFNGDGQADILWHNGATGETQVWLMDRHRVTDRQTVQDEHGQPIVVGAPWRIIGANDMSYVGWAEIAWHNDSTNEIQLWFRLGPSRRRATSPCSEWRLLGGP
jgi:hypothetical protein